VLEARLRPPSSSVLPERHLRRLATEPGEKPGLSDRPRFPPRRY
jgi:hypothetical protein